MSEGVVRALLEEVRALARSAHDPATFGGEDGIGRFQALAGAVDRLAAVCETLADVCETLAARAAESEAAPADDDPAKWFVCVTCGRTGSEGDGRFCAGCLPYVQA